MHCYSQNRYYVVPWAQKLFLGLNVLYDYEMFSSEDDFKIEANSILFEIASGYDFGRVVPRIFFDFGLPLYGLVGFSDGDGSLTKGMDIKNLKFGLEVGIKPINIPIFNLTIPLGVLFCWTTYTQKNPSYVDGYPYDRIWDYSYINLFSGIDATFQLNKHFKIGLFSRIVFPVKKEEEYKETLHGNYIWNSTGSSTRSIKSDIDVLTFSIGIGALANL
jgi:hypothetical protein